MTSSSGSTSVWRNDKPLHAVLQREATQNTVLSGTASLLGCCFSLRMKNLKGVFTFVLQVESRCCHRPKRRSVAGMRRKAIGSCAFHTFQTDRQTERLRCLPQTGRCACVCMKKNCRGGEKKEGLKSLTGRCYNIKLFCLEVR